jgi:hypothetical protein
MARTYERTDLSKYTKVIKQPLKQPIQEHFEPTNYMIIDPFVASYLPTRSSSGTKKHGLQTSRRCLGPAPHALLFSVSSTCMIYLTGYSVHWPTLVILHYFHACRPDQEPKWVGWPLRGYLNSSMISLPGPRMVAPGSSSRELGTATGPPWGLGTRQICCSTTSGLKGFLCALCFLFLFFTSLYSLLIPEQKGHLSAIRQPGCKAS